MKIIFTGGGTAGHIFPLIAIIREIRKARPQADIEFFYVGPKDDFIYSLFVKEGVRVKTILAGKIRRYFSAMNVIDIFKIPIGIIQAFIYIFVISPDLVFSKGGYGSIPVTIAARMLLTPVFLHESDSCPGLANIIAAKFALEIFTSFSVKDTRYIPVKKIISVGNPVREEIFEGSREAGQKIFNLSGEKPVILILGGSQGAQEINENILEVLPDFLKSFELIHQTGQRNFYQVKSEAEVVIPEDLRKYYHSFGFLNEQELSHAYRAADLVISRAGAGSIFEIAAVAKPSILVPLVGSAQNHQVKNAYIYAENGAAIVMEERNFTPHFLLERLKQLFLEPEKLKKMAEKGKEFSRPQAGRIIADYIITYLTQ